MRWKRQKTEENNDSVQAFMKVVNPIFTITNQKSSMQTNYNQLEILSLQDLIQQIKDIPREQFEEALIESHNTGKFIGEILEEKGLLSNEKILALIVKQCNIPFVSLVSYSIDEKIVNIIPKEVCEKYKILPIDKIGNTVTLAMVNPLDLEAIKVASKYCNNYQIRPILCSYKEFNNVITRYSLQTKRINNPAAKSPKLAEEIEDKDNYTNPKNENERENTHLIDSQTSSLEITPEEKNALNFNNIHHASSGKPMQNNILLRVVGSKFESVWFQTPAISIINTSSDGGYELLVRRIKLFHSLTTDEIVNILSICKQVNLDKDKVLFQKGEPAKSFYVLFKGKLEVFNDGRHICFLYPGEMLGEMAVFTHGKYNFSARAVESSILLDFDVNTIHCLDSPLLCVKLLTNIIFMLHEQLSTISSQFESLVYQ